MTRTILALLLGGASLAGCTTTPINVACDPFRSQFTKPVPRSETLAEIQLDVPSPAALKSARTKADVADDYSKLLALSMPDTESLHGKTDEAVLALSGGGQWGAFGAGYLRQLQQDGKLPRFRLVTGVSTGALQALFVGANQGAAGMAGKPGDPRFLDRLADEYAITDERDVVYRRGEISGALRGAIAKLDPLRLKIEKALCGVAPADPKTPGDCQLIAALAADGAPVVMLGFVEARTGEMQAVNVSAIAQAATKGQMTAKEAQQCITAGALASVAMPLFYQQVQVTSKEPGAAGKSETVTYYDGGVRQSLFLFETLSTLDQIDGKAAGATARPVYMIRNGPTTAKVEEESNRRLNGLKTAKRGYSLLVNQSEVSAIETIRLRDSQPVMKLATADGYDATFKDPVSGERICIRPEGEVMFDREFMECLQALGRSKAVSKGSRPEGWITLTPPRPLSGAGLPARP